MSENVADTGTRTCVLNCIVEGSRLWCGNDTEKYYIAKFVTNERKREREKNWTILYYIIHLRASSINVAMCLYIYEFAWQNCCDQIDWLKIDTLIWISINPRKFTSANAVWKMCTISPHNNSNNETKFTLYRIVLILSIYSYIVLYINIMTWHDMIWYIFVQQ